MSFRSTERQTPNKTKGCLIANFATVPLSLTVLAAPLAGLKARFAAYMDTAAEQGMTPEMFAQACAKGMAEQERRAMQEQAARDADPKQPQEDSPVSTPTP